MLIGNQDVPKDLILEYCRVIKELKYCRVIKELEFKFNLNYESKRSELHNQIFECVGCERSLYRKRDRIFNKALNIAVMDLIFENEV